MSAAAGDAATEPGLNDLRGRLLDQIHAWRAEAMHWFSQPAVEHANTAARGRAHELLRAAETVEALMEASGVIAEIPADAGLTPYECPQHFDCDGGCGYTYRRASRTGPTEDES